jgi:hypothetical protein
MEIDFVAWQTIVHYVGKDHSLRSERSFSIGLQYWEQHSQPHKNVVSTPWKQWFDTIRTLLWCHKHRALMP